MTANQATRMPHSTPSKHRTGRCLTSSQWFLCVIVLFTIFLPRISGSESSARELQRYSVAYKNPSLHWMIRLPAEQLFHGNAIVQSPYDSSILYVTTNSGKLLALSLLNGNLIASVSVAPTVITEDGGTETWTIHCNSGISFGELNDGGKFMVYSVQDTPPEDSLYGPKTRVIAVSIPGHQVLWTSAGLEGSSNGSPLLYANKGDSKSYVFLTHNSRYKDFDNSTTTVGHITFLQTVTGHVVWTDSEWSSGGDPIGYSPPGIVSDPAAGMFSGGSSNTNDIIVWSNSDHDGRGTQGFTFVFQLPMDYSGTRAQVDDLRTEPLKVVRWNSVVPPVFNKNGTHLFMGVGGSELRGWVGGTLFDETATWAANLIDTVGDPLAPVPAAPTLSLDETRLFVPSAETELMCIDTLTGETNWALQGTSTFLARSKVSPDDKRLYVIQSVDGRIFSHDQLTGDLNWLASCDQFEEDCANAVRADFEISSTGQFLIYGDVMGRIIALKLGNLVENTEATTAPGVGMFGPTDTAIWSDGDDETAESYKSGIALGVSIFLIVLATIIAIASLAYIIFMNSLKSVPHPMQEPYIEDDSTLSSSDYSLPSDPENAPDKYEDSLISQHKLPLQSLIHLQIPMPMSRNEKTFDSAFENMGFAPADRISVLLGTANRIAPISDDFSLGAAVLV